MAAYIIAQVNVTNPEKYQEYAKLAGPASARYGGRFLVRGGTKTPLEGDIPYQRIVVTELRDSTFYASIALQRGADGFEVSSRPSDAIALAVRMAVPIFAEEGVLDEASILMTGDEDEEVEKFREFLDNVSPEDFAP